MDEVTRNSIDCELRLARERFERRCEALDRWERMVWVAYVMVLAGWVAGIVAGTSFRSSCEMPDVESRAVENDV